MAKDKSRNYVDIKCPECNNFFRPTSKNKKNTTEKLELKKYCPTCNKYVVAKEKK